MAFQFLARALGFPSRQRVPVLVACLLSCILASAADTPPSPQAPPQADPPRITKENPNDRVLIRDITSVSGIRSNPLIGYGLVVGLNGTGDRRQTFFTTQTLANVMQRMGVQISPSAVRVNNVAAVFVIATLPPFSRPGTTIDVTVSSIGDAKSLEGGILLMTPMQGPDGKVYAAAQGPLALGGYSAGGQAGNGKQVNHPTVAQISNGATVEHDTSIDLTRMTTVSFMLRDADFTASRNVAASINGEFGKILATAVDSRRVDVDVSEAGALAVPELISKIQNLAIAFHPPAKIVINERTGTIVMGGDVKLSAVSVLHGNLTIDVTTSFLVSQPLPLAKGDTTVVPDIGVQAKEGPLGKIQLPEGSKVEDLVSGLHGMGATARDVVAILEAIKAAGGLRAELEVQ